MGAFFTLTTSPRLMMNEGLREMPPTVTRPFLQASAAMLRVLYMRAAQSHLSILALSFFAVLVFVELLQVQKL